MFEFDPVRVGLFFYRIFTVLGIFLLLAILVYLLAEGKTNNYTAFFLGMLSTLLERKFFNEIFEIEEVN